MKAPAATPLEHVWVASTWPAPVVFHAHTHDRTDRQITVRGITGPMAGWAFTACGQLTYYPTWDADAGRFYLAGNRGTSVPHRLLNPTAVRPCRRCYADA